MNKRVVLLILDGWGISPDPSVSAIDQANTPFIDGLYSRFPHATLRTFGMNAGLPDGQMGNSEVGHMNLGAGRVVYQDLAKINLAVQEHSLGAQPALQQALTYAREQEKNVHFMGLLSDGGVHSHIAHLEELLRVCGTFGGVNAYVHAFTDGRDVDPKSGLGFVRQIQQTCAQTGARLATVTGRYFAMDRDKRWERIKLAYDAIVHGQGNLVSSMEEGVQESYEQGVTDEFIQPIVQDNGNGQPLVTLDSGDVVVFFNFRTDRGRELTLALSQQDFPEHGMKKLDLKYVTMTRYDDTFRGVDVIYDKENISETLGEVLSRAGVPQLRIAETEKYPHVTFFFNGGREQPFEGEQRILIPSPKVATYDLKPEMSAFEVRDSVLPELRAQRPSFVCLNFANPDMVGHTGVMEAAIKACETVDSCVRDIVNTGTEHGYSFIILADHGNCDTMRNPDGSPNTAHTTNLVPIIIVDPDAKGVNEGVLGDIAPSVLFLMGIEQPEAMSGTNLIRTV